VTVLPGSFLARDAGGPAAIASTPSLAVPPPPNPGRGRIRMALVAGTDECVEAARRIVDFVRR
jgi:N-succinyldiaminopimelate aminotransferase